MRLFVEASLDDVALDAVWEASRALRDRPGFPASSVRWVKREALHLTLRFLGEVDTDHGHDHHERDHVDNVEHALAALSGVGSISLQIESLTAFGGRRPRVIALVPRRGAPLDRLVETRARLDDALELVGFAREQRPVRPHLTLGRVRRQAGAAERSAIRLAIDDAPPLQIAATVRSVALVQSTLTADGPHYRRLARVEL